MKLSTLCLASILLCLILSNGIEAQQDAKPFISATLARARFSQGNMQSPSWKVTMVVHNNTTGELQLGESLVVLEKARDDLRYAACYVTREGAESGRHLQRVKDRYGLQWGQEINRTDGDSIAVLPVERSSSGRLTQDDVFRFMQSILWLHNKLYDGRGYGRVAPHSDRKIETEVIAPIGLKENVKREYVAVILPSVRPLGAGLAATSYTVCRFEVGEGAISRDVVFNPSETMTVSMRPKELYALASDSTQELWRRVFVLNWFTETHPEEATKLLLELATGRDAPQKLRQAATLNLGVAKANTAVQPLLALLQRPEDNDLRQWVIAALGDIGNPNAAAAIRPLIDDKEQEVALAAIEAVGNIKDAESVSLLLAALNDKKNQDQTKATLRDKLSSALAAIGNRAAVDGLVQILRDPKSELRGLAAQKVALTKAPEAAAALIAIAADNNTPASLYETVLEALGSVGGKESDQTTIAALKSKHATVRGKAASQLRQRKVADALAALWLAYQVEREEQTGAEMARALIELKFADKSVVPFLTGRLDPKKNPLWFQDVELLRSLTGQNFGPEHRWGDEKVRDAELEKWRQWARKPN